MQKGHKSPMHNKSSHTDKRKKKKPNKRTKEESDLIFVFETNA